MTVDEDFFYKRNCWEYIKTAHPEKIEAIVLGKFPKNPVHVEIHPHHFSTPLCNNHCPGCTGGIYRKIGGENFGIEPERLIKTIEDFKGKVNDIIFSGNSIEPLLYPEIIESIKAVHDIGAMFSLYSNFYNAGRSGVLEELTSPSINGDYIRISLNAGRKESYQLSHYPGDPNAFEVILENVKELLRLKNEKNIASYVHLTYLLDKHNSNKQELESIVKWAAENSGINEIRFSTYQKPLGKQVPQQIDFLEEEFRETVTYIQELSKEYIRDDFSIWIPWEKTEKSIKEKTFLECRVGYLFPVIGMDGGVYPCTSMASPENPSCSYGNINKEEFWNIWRKIKGNEKFSMENCYDCTRGEFDINQKMYNLIKDKKI